MAERHFLDAIQCYKLVILGASSVGKTSIVGQYTRGEDITYGRGTKVASFSCIYLANNVKFDAWEVAGDERWHRLAPLYYKDAQAALVVYDVTDEQSLEMAKEWISEIRRSLHMDVVIAIVGNKLDLRENYSVDSVVVRKYAELNDYIFMETSAKTGENIQELFEEIADKLQERSCLRRKKKKWLDFGCACVIL